MLDDAPGQLLAGTIALNTRKLVLAAASQQDLDAELTAMTELLQRYSNVTAPPLAVKPSLDQLAHASKRLQLVNAKLLGIEKRLQDVDCILQSRSAAS